MEMRLRHTLLFPIRHDLILYSGTTKPAYAGFGYGTGVAYFLEVTISSCTLRGTTA